MKVFQKVSALALSTAMLLTMASCGNGDTANPSDNSANAGNDSTEEIVLNFPCIWVAKDSKAEVFGEMVAAFNEENAGKIKVVIEEQTDYQAYRDKIRTMITTGNAPDIFTIDNVDDLTNFSNSGKLLDLTEYMTDDWKADFTTGSVDAARVGDGLYALPYESAYFPVLYNKQLLAEAGYDHFPTTYDELWDCCEKLLANGVTPMSQMTGENAYTTQLWFTQAIVAVGGKDIYENGLSDPAFVEAAEIVRKMFDYTTSDAVGAGAAVSAGHFLNERTAIFMNGPWFFGRIATEGTEGLVDNVELAYPPMATGGKGEEHGMTGQVQAYLALGNQTDPAKAEAAVSFLQFITQPEWVAKLSVSSGSLFAVKFDEPEGMSKLQSQLVSMIADAPYVAPAFANSVPVAVMTELPQALDALVLDSLTPQEFMDTLSALS